MTDTPIPTVQDVMHEELDAQGLDPDRLDPASHALIQSITPALDHVISSLDGKPEALRVAAAALRSYARVTEQYVAALESR